MLRSVFLSTMQRLAHPMPWRALAPVRPLSVYSGVYAENDQGAEQKAQQSAEQAAKEQQKPEPSPQEKEIAELKDKAKEFQDKWVRSLAELITQRDIAVAREYAVTEFAKDMLSVADNLERALTAVPEQARAENKLLQNLYDGVKMTQSGLASVLQRHGVVKIPTVGEKFDPNVHNALFELDDPKYAPGVVSQMTKQGYMIKDRVLRVSDVGVVRQPSQ